MQSQRNLLDGAVEIADAAGFQFSGVFRVEHQIPFVFRQLVRTQSLLNLLLVNRQRIDAPEIRDGIFVARIDGFHHFQQIGIDIGVIGNLRFVDFLICAGFNLAADIGNRRRNQIITRLAGQQLGFQRFVAVVVIVADVDMRFVFKCRQRGRIDIIRPVVDIEFIGLGRGSLRGGRFCGGSLSAAARSQDEAHDCRRHQRFFHGFRPFVRGVKILQRWQMPLTKGKLWGRPACVLCP